MPDALRGDGTRRTVPSFAFPEAAAHALGPGRRPRRLAPAAPTGTVPEFHDIDEAAARRLVDEQLRSGTARGPAGTDGVWLDATASAALLGCFGIPVLAPRLVHSADEAGGRGDASSAIPSR